MLHLILSGCHANPVCLLAEVERLFINTIAKQISVVSKLVKKSSNTLIIQTCDKKFYI